MMNYKFPKIENIGQIEAAIRGREEFSVNERDGFTVVLYHVNFVDTFPPVKTLNHAIRRELRGIKFDATGNTIARTYHKFFNVNERPETSENIIDWDSKFDILEKLDGSMIHPMLLNDEVVFCTKAGITDIAAPAEKFALEHKKINYLDFCHHIMRQGYTPLFEWCSNKNRIVLSYPNDRLVLTGVRHIIEGRYMDMNEMDTAAIPFNVPVVKRWAGTFDGITAFNNEVENLEDEEGYVFRFSNGHMLKRKNVWYLQLHKVKELFQFEKDVWRIIITNKIDDAKSFMDDDAKKRLDAFATDLLETIDFKADELKWIVIAAKDNLNESKKRFAIEVVPKYHKTEKGILFSIWDGYDPRETIVELLLKHCNSGTRLEEIRPLVNGLRWDDYNE